LKEDLYQIQKARVINSLKEYKFFKFISGAALHDFDLVYKYSYFFAKAKAHMIDLSAYPNVVESASKALFDSGVRKEELPALMISLSLEEDLHFRRVEVDYNNCTSCRACIPACPTQAFDFDFKNKVLNYQKSKCYGCGSCLSFCNDQALSTRNLKPFSPEVLNELWSLGASWIEIHVGNKFEELKNFQKELKNYSQKNWSYSICIGSNYASFIEIQEQVREITKLFGKETLVQIDGRPMSGAKKKNSSNLQALAALQAALETKEKLFFQISGGINDQIYQLIRLFDLKPNGIGVGSFAKKRLQSFLSPGLNSSCDLEKAISIAKELVYLARQ